MIIIVIIILVSNWKLFWIRILLVKICIKKGEVIESKFKIIFNKNIWIIIWW